MELAGVTPLAKKSTRGPSRLRIFAAFHLGATQDPDEEKNLPARDRHARKDLWMPRETRLAGEPTPSRFRPRGHRRSPGNLGCRWPKTVIQSSYCGCIAGLG